ncbi:unnamed protein product [Alopecurus aequalis]
MSSFAGVSMVNGCEEVHTTPAFDTGTDSGHHLLVVKNYSRTVQEVPNGESIRSGRFMVGGYKWCIRYSPNGGDPSCADFISLHLRLLDNVVQLPVETQFSFCFANDLENQKPVYIGTTDKCNFLSRDPCWGIGEFVRRDVLEKSANLNDDCFTIRCDVMVRSTRDMSDIGQQFYNLLQHKVGADVTFEVSGEKFSAHRCVLAARSTVFMAQLFGPMKEGTTSSVIQIKDMEAKVFAALLSFIYTDSFPKMDKDTNTEEEEGQDEEEDIGYVMWLQDLFVAADS